MSVISGGFGFRRRMILWVVIVALYSLFFGWYTHLGGPLTQVEKDFYIEKLMVRSKNPGSLAAVRRFVEADDGKAFIMVNILDLANKPPVLPATGSDAQASDLLAHYMEHMFPALLRRACHPIWLGDGLNTALEVIGIEDATRWDQAALMRYRSRKDFLEIVVNPAFSERHDYKLAGLDKTIAFPADSGWLSSDPRLLVALILMVIALILDRLVSRTRSA